MPRTAFKLCLGFVILFLSLAESTQVKAQTHDEPVAAAGDSSSLAVSGSEPVTEADPQSPMQEPLELPVSPDHFWNRITLELSGGYSPTVSSGAGYYGPGFTASGGATDRISGHWRVQAEGQILGLHGNLSHLIYGSSEAAVASYAFTAHLDALYNLRPDAVNSPYLIGGAGYYHLGVHTVCVTATIEDNCASGSDDPFASDVAVNAAGFNFGAGIRHRIYADRHAELFVEARYHYIASGSSLVGQVSVLPVSAGIRW